MEITLFEPFATGLAAFYSVIPVYGVAIILLTLAVRILLLPLSIKQTRSQREMQRIMPELKAIQKKYKGDRQKLSEEQMKLYKEHGVNPLGGCLPLLMQFPVLIALYYVISAPTKYMSWVEGSKLQSLLTQGADVWERVHTFAGIRLDCSAAHFMFDLPLFGQARNIADTPGVPEGVTCGSGSFEPIGLVYLVLVLVMGFTTYFMQKQLQGRNPQMNEQAQQMQMFTKIMPPFLMLIAWAFPAGVVVYWLTTNLWTIVQQMLILKVVPHETPAGAKGDKAAIPAKATTKPAAGSPTQTEGDNGQRSPTRASKPHPSSKKKKKKR